ncbi:MAG TPA: hypothetical protein VGU01_05855 [Sphingomicrobium sp.]|nr:hypothetical protein [Sphingomicrobium sp.]
MLEALSHLESALEILDRAAAPGQIGAHVDLAIHDLSASVDAVPRPGSLDQIDWKAEPQ